MSPCFSEHACAQLAERREAIWSVRKGLVNLVRGGVKTPQGGRGRACVCGKRVRRAPVYVGYIVIYVCLYGAHVCVLRLEHTRVRSVNHD